VIGVATSVLDRYAEVLEQYLAAPSEDGLNAAYEIGRTALRNRLGVLDIAILHHNALRDLIARGSPAVVQARVGAAAEFFAESLSSYEMMLRGYEERNAQLVATNEALRQAKAAAEVANRELESFSYSVAHDLRAPLRSINAFTEILLEDCADRLDEEGKAHLGYIRQSTRQMAELIDGLLELSRITRSELRWEEVDLGELAHDVMAELRRGDPARHVEVQIASGLVAEGDPRLLRTVLQNLLGNAWKFTGNSDPARIEFGCEVSIDRPSFFIRDNGAGFDMAYASKLFGAFSRLHSEREFPGTGIGLATVQRIIHRHDGHIWAEGAIGSGATFHFTIGSAIKSL
jgi:light-regulated signal transduction histidine kinase (bacteriophytochrome)